MRGVLFSNKPLKILKTIIANKQKSSVEYALKNKINQDEVISTSCAGGDKDLMLFGKIILDASLVYSFASTSIYLIATF